MKICKVCLDKLPETSEYFYHQKGAHNNLRARCKPCSNKENSQYALKNKDLLVKKRKLKYYKNLLVNREKHRINYQKNRDKILEKRKKYYNENKEMFSRISRKCYIKHKNTRLIYQNNYNRVPLQKVKINIRNSINKALKKRGYTKKTKTYKILGCDYISFFNHLCLTFENNYNLPRSTIIWKDVHIDHIIPLKTCNSEEDVIKLNHYTNLQLLLAVDNLSKGSKLEWQLM